MKNDLKTESKSVQENKNIKVCLISLYSSSAMGPRLVAANTGRGAHATFDCDQRLRQALRSSALKIRPGQSPHLGRRASIKIACAARIRTSSSESTSVRIFP